MTATPFFIANDLDTSSDKAFFKSVCKSTYDFFKWTIVWGLEQFEIGRQNGAHDKSFCAQVDLEQAAFGLLKIEDENVYDVMITKTDEGRYFGDGLFGKALRDLLSEGVITYDQETRGVATLLPVVA